MFGFDNTNFNYMGVKILTADSGEQVLYDSVTMTAFGVVHENQDYELEGFLEWLEKDARTYNQTELNDLYYEWLKYVQMEADQEPPEPDYNAPNAAERAEMMYRIQRDIK